MEPAFVNALLSALPIVVFGLVTLVGCTIYVWVNQE